MRRFLRRALVCTGLAAVALAATDVPESTQPYTPSGGRTLSFEPTPGFGG